MRRESEGVQKLEEPLVDLEGRLGCEPAQQALEDGDASGIAAVNGAADAEGEGNRVEPLGLDGGEEPLGLWLDSVGRLAGEGRQVTGEHRRCDVVVDVLIEERPDLVR
jgi:hypothetical protein